MKERDIEDIFIWHVMRHGGVTFKFETPNRRGAPDRIACFPSGATWFVELKRPKGGRYSPHQNEFAADMARLKQKYARLHTVEAIESWINDAAA